jgi:hypothetical protein
MVRHLVLGEPIKYILRNKQNARKNIIEHMLMANGFNPNVLDNLNKQKRMKIEKEITQEPKKKWITFTYMGKETRYITKLFRIRWPTASSRIKLPYINEKTTIFNRNYILTCFD